MSPRPALSALANVSDSVEDTLTFTRERGEWMVEVRTEEGRRLLGIRYDGTWEIEPEDAPEAARLFAEAVAAMLHRPLA